MPISNPPFIPLFGNGLPTQPAPPNTIYFDRANKYAMYVFDSGQWNPMGAFGSYPPSIRQGLVVPNSGASLTMAQAPVNGNIMVAFAMTGNVLTPGAGWASHGNATHTQNFYCMSKTVAGDGATVTPFSGGTTVGTAAIFEMQNVTGTFEQFQSNYNATGGCTNTFTTTGADEMIIGLCAIDNNDGGNGIFPVPTGASVAFSSADVNRKGVGFDKFAAAAGANVISFTNAASHAQGMVGIAIK